MKQIIKDKQIVADSWLHVADDAELPATGDVFLGLSRFVELASSADGGLGQRRVGVRLRSDDRLDTLIPVLSAASAVAVEFPKFGDGRGYTLARLLRDRHGYTGELRAIGNVLQDQLFYLTRCGFDAFELTAGKSLEAALAAFADFSVVYQTAADGRTPRYGRSAV